MSTRNSGVSTQMSINQTGVNSTSFDYSYYVDSGWAVDPNQPSVSIDFHVVDTSPQNGTNDYSFVLQQKSDNRGRVTGRYYGIEALTTNSAVISSGNSGGRDDHMFVLRRVKGNYISAGSVNLLPPNNGGMGGMGMGGGTLVNPADAAGAPPDGILPNPQPGPFPQPPGGQTGNPMGMGGNNTSPPGGTVTWNTGNEVQVIWIGQVCPGCGLNGMGMGGGMDPDIRRIVAERAEPAALIEMVNDKDWMVRLTVTNNINYESLYLLENDPEEEVREAVKTRLSE